MYNEQQASRVHTIKLAAAQTLLWGLSMGAVLRRQPENVVVLQHMWQAAHQAFLARKHRGGEARTAPDANSPISAA